MSRGFRAPSLSTYDIFTLYTNFPHNLIKEKLTDLTETTFQREGSNLALNEKSALFTSDNQNRFVKKFVTYYHTS